MHSMAILLSVLLEASTLRCSIILAISCSAGLPVSVEVLSVCQLLLDEFTIVSHCQLSVRHVSQTYDILQDAGIDIRDDLIQELSK